MRTAIGVDGKEKKCKEILELLEIPKVGKPIKLRVAEGIVRTTPVTHCLLGSQTYVETVNTIYGDSRYWRHDD